MKTIIYGDLHGCIDEFIQLREKINPQKEDQEICVGDIITKGPASIQILRYLHKHNILSILGNHEEKILRYLKHEKQSKSNPVKLDQDEKSIVKNLNISDVQYLESLPLFYHFKNLLIIHAGVQNSMNLNNLNKREQQKVIRLRYIDTNGHFVEYGKETNESIFWSDIYNGTQGFVVYGHQPFREPKINKYSLGIDTGCVYGNRLSAAVFDLNKDNVSYQVINVPAKRVYYRSQSFF